MDAYSFGTLWFVKVLSSTAFQGPSPHQSLNLAGTDFRAARGHLPRQFCTTASVGLRADELYSRGWSSWALDKRSASSAQVPRSLQGEEQSSH
jgi:hypothetical protein